MLTQTMKDGAPWWQCACDGCGLGIENPETAVVLEIAGADPRGAPTLVHATCAAEYAITTGQTVISMLPLERMLLREVVAGRLDPAKLKREKGGAA